MRKRSKPAPLGVDATNFAVAGPHGPVPVRHYARANGRAAVGLPIVWLHGGGFYSGGLDQAETHKVALALARVGFEVTTVDYRLVTLGSQNRDARGASERSQARRRDRRTPPQVGRRGQPSIRYPVPLDDVVAVVAHVASHSPDGVLLGGASAGACLAAGAAYRLQRAGASPVRGLFFAYGTFHAQLPERSPELLSRLRGRRRYVHTPWLIGAMNLNYAGNREVLSVAEAFPGGHNLAGFPPSLVMDADRDAMRASGSLFARELAEAGVVTDHRLISGSAHAFLNRPRDPAFTVGIDTIATWARDLGAPRE